MGKTVTAPTLAVKIMTRDSPITLKLTLDSLHNDISKGRLSISIVLIDDSRNETNRNLNKTLLTKVFEKDHTVTKYFGRDEWAKVLNCVQRESACNILTQIGLLGSPNYQPSRAKNVSLLVNTHADFELLLDDDILIDPKNKSKISTVETTLDKARTDNSFVGTNLLGFPDVSSLQLLERSIVGSGELHEWNNDPSDFSLSGGYLFYPIIEDLPAFPKSYNEDFFWVAYGLEKFHMTANKLLLNVYHSPIKPKSLSRGRLAYEAKGEILFETLRLTNRNSLIERQIPPSKKEIETAISEFLEYVDYVLGLVKKNKNDNQIDSLFLRKIDSKYYEKILLEHSKYVRNISFLRLQEFIADWIEQISQWTEIRKDLGTYIFSYS